jgi:DNA-binding MarR family transcriptional regulator
MTDTTNDAATDPVGRAPASGTASLAPGAPAGAAPDTQAPSAPGMRAPAAADTQAPAAPDSRAGSAPGAPGGGAAGLPPALGTAERAMTRLLLDVLAETGTPEMTWYAFQRLSVLQPVPTPDAFRRDLSHELELDDVSAAALLDQIVAAGLMHEVSDPDGGEARVALTAEGESVRARIRRSVAALLAELVESVDPKDLEVTTRTLTRLTERARELHGRPVSAAAGPGKAES